MKFAICNEIYQDWEFADFCRSAAAIGYTGIEIAPFTLAPLVTELSADRRRELRQQAQDGGLTVVGLHWLLAKTSGFHLNSTDPGIRRRTSEYLVELTHCCADLGGELMVFGSPNARQIPEDASLDEALEYAAETLRDMTDVLAERNVKLCLEPLGPAETDFLTTADEADRLRRMVDHPNVLLHLDVKAMSSEPQPIPEIIRKHAAVTGHFHANDPNLRGPGMGDVRFEPIFEALGSVGYHGWVSVEVFDFTPDPETIARESLEYMKRCLAK